MSFLSLLGCSFLRRKLDHFCDTRAILPRGGAHCDGGAHFMSVRISRKGRRADPEDFPGPQCVLCGRVATAVQGGEFICVEGKTVVGVQICDRQRNG